MSANNQYRFVKRVSSDYEPLGCVLTESRYPPLFQMNPHVHENAYFGIVLRGSYSEHIKSKARVYDQTALVLHPAGETHSVRFHNAPTHIFRVELGPPMLTRVRQYSTLLDAPGRISSNSTFYLMTRLYNEFLEPDAVAPLVIEGLILEILAAAARGLSTVESTHPRWLRTAKEFVHAGFTKPLRLSEVAAAAGVHPVYLAREFRKRYRTTVGEYVRRLRVEAACRALAEPGADLSDIAASLGFADQSHLGRHFKRLTGFTPAQYRANIKGRG